jgi:enoyl-CoA hydratase/carnithine racemase
VFSDCPPLASGRAPRWGPPDLVRGPGDQPRPGAVTDRRSFTAQQAYDWGAVAEVGPDRSALTRALGLAALDAGDGAGMAVKFDAVGHMAVTGRIVPGAELDRSGADQNKTTWGAAATSPRTSSRPP